MKRKNVPGLPMLVAFSSILKSREDALLREQMPVGHIPLSSPYPGISSHISHLPSPQSVGSAGTGRGGHVSPRSVQSAGPPAH